MKKVKLLISAFLICVLLFMTGCTENTELYQRILIKAIGIDSSGSGFTVTVRVADYAEGKEYNLTKQGESVFEAINALQLAEGRKPMYSHSHFIIYGREILEGKLQNAMDFFIRYYKAHPKVDIFAAEKTAAEILNYKNEDGLIPSDRLHKLTTAQDIAGKAVSTSLMKFVSDSNDVSLTAMLPEMSMTDNGAAITGTALMREYSYSDSISNYETMGILAAQGKVKHSVITAFHEELGLITAEINDCKSKITPSDDYSTWSVDVELTMSLASLSLGSYDLTEDSYKDMETILAVVVKNYISSAVAAAYKNDADVLNLAYRVYIDDPEYWRANSSDWHNGISGMQFNVNVTSKVERLGEEDH